MIVIIINTTGNQWRADPGSERVIGYSGENNITTILFSLPAQYGDWNYTLDCGADIVALDPTVDGEHLTLTWTVTDRQLTQRRLAACIRATRGDQIRKTNIMYFSVLDSVDPDTVIPSPLPSEFTDAEQRMVELRDCTGTAAAVAETASQAATKAASTAETAAQAAGSQADRSEHAADGLESLLPAGSATGTESVMLDNCAALPLKSLVVRGASKQEGCVDFEKIAQSGIYPTPEHPITPSFVGNGGTVTVTVCGENILDGETQTAALPSPLIGAEDWVDVISGDGEKAWIKIEMDGVTAGQKFTSADVYYTHGYNYAYFLPSGRLKAQSIPVCTHAPHGVAGQKKAAVFVTSVLGMTLPDAITGVTSSDTKQQLVIKFNAWLAAEKAAGSPVIIWYQSTVAAPIEIQPLTLHARPGITNVLVTGSPEDPVPEITATYIKDPNLLMLDQAAYLTDLDARIAQLEISAGR